MAKFEEITEKEKSKLRELVKWIQGCGHTDVVPVQMNFRYSRRFGVRYTRLCVAPAGSPAASQPATFETMYYLLGAIPKEYKFGAMHNTPTVFTMIGDEYCWYVAFYSQHIEPQYEAYAPFGPCFGIGRWDHVRLGSRIDAHQRKPAKLLMMLEKVLDLTVPDVQVVESADELLEAMHSGSTGLLWLPEGDDKDEAKPFGLRYGEDDWCIELVDPRSDDDDCISRVDLTGDAEFDAEHRIPLAGLLSHALLMEQALTLAKTILTNQVWTAASTKELLQQVDAALNYPTKVARNDEGRAKIEAAD